MVGSQNTSFFANLLVVRNWHSTIQIVIDNRIQLRTVVVVNSLRCLLIILEYLCAGQLIRMIAKRCSRYDLTLTIFLNRHCFVDHQGFVLALTSFKLLVGHEQIVLIHLAATYVGCLTLERWFGGGIRCLTGVTFYVGMWSVYSKFSGLLSYSCSSTSFFGAKSALVVVAHLVSHVIMGQV